MKSTPARPSAREYLDSLAGASRYTFTTAEARSALGISPAALKVTLNRLARQKRIVSPARGFHVLVPPEYRSLGCLPADQFIPALMTSLQQPYYVGLLTAAQYHGAAHQRPQEFQVFLEKSRRPLACGLVRVAFIVRKNLRKVPAQTFNTPRGTVLVSTPEATALDLAGYPQRAGGLNQVATVLGELAETIDQQKLAEAAASAPVPWSQRLGYLLDRAGAADKTEALKAWVRMNARESTLLQPRASRANASRRDDWKLVVNAEVEIEL